MRTTIYIHGMKSNMRSVTGRRYARRVQNYLTYVQTSLTSIPKLVLLAAGDEPEDADLEAPKVYEPAGTLDILKDRLGVFMASYNEMVRGGHMDLVFFKVQILSVTRVTRSQNQTSSR